MTVPPQGLATFPGIEHLIDASITLGHGIAPATAQLSIAPQADLPHEHGTLTFTFDSVTVEFPNCRVAHGGIERNAQGEVCRLSIVDRRWRWQFGRISGRYNLRRDDASLKQGQLGSIDTERTPRQLATLCLEAMDESDFDVDDLPNDTRPCVEWEDEVPAEALAQLCDRLGCRVVLQWDNCVAIRRVGEGATLDEEDTMQYSAAFDLPAKPDKLVVVGGPTRHQVDFPLEAVGLLKEPNDASEMLLPIDDLPYKPAAGWSKIDLPYFHQVDAAARTLARKSVFRYYRIKMPVAVPGYEGDDGNLVERREQILPIEAAQVALVGENGQWESRPALVFGVWHDGGSLPSNRWPVLEPLEAPEQPDPPRSIYRRAYAIDTARGLVIFSEPVYRNAHASGSGGAGFELEVAPAQLVLRATCKVRHPESLALTRYQRERDTGGSAGTQPRYLLHDELARVCRPEYDADYDLVDVVSNDAVLDDQADALLDVAEQDYTVDEPQSATYAGLIPVDVDGAIQQVRLSIGRNGATTTVSRNHERPALAPTQQAQRQARANRAALRASDQVRPGSLARAIVNNPDLKPRNGS